MKEDLNRFHYLSQLLEKRTEKYEFPLGDILFLLEILHTRIKKFIQLVNPIDEALKLYFKISTITEDAYDSPDSNVSVELTGSQAYFLMLCVFMDSSDYKMKERVYHNLYYGLLGTTINEVEDEVI
ncbi:MAG: hypothetical protein Q4C05_09255 [Akkermansia sp.]|nr:hypothetical protein [Akkermansia sp.]